MKRDDAIHELRAARKELQDTLVGMAEEDYLRPKAIEKWTVKDLVAHVAAWDEELVRVLQAFSMQNEPIFTYLISSTKDFGAWNEEQLAQRKDLTVSQVVSEFEKARRDLIQVIEGLTDPVLSRTKTTSWGERQTGFDLIATQVAHDREHARQVMSYRKKIERWARARQKLTAKRKTKID
jgi:uncharacterized damage-inducible protein DinB